MRWVSVALSIACLLGAAGLPPNSLYRADLTWTDDAGASFRLASLSGTPVVLTMFYTSCSTLCPATLGKLREIEAALAQRHLAAKFVLVSYDSHADTPKVMARYRNIHKLSRENWLMLRGSEETVAQLASRVGLADYADLSEHVVHSYRIVVLDDDGVIVKSLDWKHNDVVSLFETAWP